MFQFGQILGNKPVISIALPTLTLILPENQQTSQKMDGRRIFLGKSCVGGMSVAKVNTGCPNKSRTLQFNEFSSEITI